MMMRSLSVIAAFFAAIAIAACEPTDVLLARLPASEAGAPFEKPCVDESDCDGDSLCSKPTCGASTGRCERRPFACGSEFAPVCGCDRVTYWNDCLRRSYGVEAQILGECTFSAARCGGPPPGGACPVDGASCSRISPPRAPCPPADAPGTCWVLPAVCADGPGPAFQRCGSNECVGVCAAIRSEHPHHVAGPGECDVHP